MVPSHAASIFTFAIENKLYSPENLVIFILFLSYTFVTLTSNINYSVIF